VQRRKESGKDLLSLPSRTTVYLVTKSHGLVMPTKEASVNRTKGKDQAQRYCSQSTLTVLPTDPSFLGMTKPPTLLIKDRLITIRRVVQAKHCTQTSPLRWSEATRMDLPSPTCWRGAGGEVFP
jgi:hypothetical protein